MEIFFNCQLCKSIVEMSVAYMQYIEHKETLFANKGVGISV
jgi:hypothetical protein